MLPVALFCIEAYGLLRSLGYFALRGSEGSDATASEDFHRVKMQKEEQSGLTVYPLLSSSFWKCSCLRLNCGPRASSGNGGEVEPVPA